MHPLIRELLRDFAFLLEMFWLILRDFSLLRAPLLSSDSVSDGTALRFICTGGGAVEWSSCKIADEYDDGSNHEALLRPAEPTPAHVFLLEESLLSIGCILAVAGDHDMRLEFCLDVDDGTPGGFSWKVYDVQDTRFLFPRDTVWKCAWEEKSQYPKDPVWINQYHEDNVENWVIEWVLPHHRARKGHIGSVDFFLTSQETRQWVVYLVSH